MSNKLNNWLNTEFHDNYSRILFKTLDVHKDFMSEVAHCYIDAKNFPNLNISIKHPKEIVELLPKEFFDTYIKTTLSSPLVYVYHYDGGVLIGSGADKVDIKKGEKINEILEKYIKAYENGLLKDAYTKAFESGKHQIFAVINGDAKVFDVDDLGQVFESYNVLGSVEEWAMECFWEEGGPLVSYIMVDQAEELFWYGLMEYEYELNLLKKWGIPLYE